MVYLHISSFHMCFHLMKGFFTLKKKFEDHRTASWSKCYQWAPSPPEANFQEAVSGNLWSHRFPTSCFLWDTRTLCFQASPESILPLLTDSLVKCRLSQMLTALRCSPFFSCCPPLFKAHGHQWWEASWSPQALISALAILGGMF